MSFKLNFKKMLLQRYIIYPLIIGTITVQILSAMQGTSLNDLINQHGLYAMIDKILGVQVSYDEGKYIYGYVVGFAYGTISQLIKVRSFGKGLIAIILFLIKYYMCFFFLGTLAFFWIPLEVITIAFGFFLYIIFRKKKDNNTNTLTN